MPKKKNTQADREGLTKFGLTDVGLEVWYALAAAAGKMLQLPVLHPMEQQELVQDFHHQQNRLLARPG